MKARRLRDRLRIAVQPVLAGIAVLTLVFGSIGYHTYLSRHGLPAGPVDVAYAQLDLFRLGNRPDGALPWTLQVARALVPIVVGYGFFRATFALFRERVDRLRLQTRSGQVLVIGTGPVVRDFATAMRRLHPKIVVLRHEPDTALSPGSLLRGTLSFRGDATVAEVVEEAGLGRATTVVVLTDDDSLNLTLVLRARSRAAAAGVAVRAVAAVSRAELCRSLRVDALNDANNRCSVDYINTAELTARTIVAELRRVLDPPTPTRSPAAPARRLTILLDAPPVLASQVAVRIAREVDNVNSGSNDAPVSVTVSFVGADAPFAVEEARRWAPGLDGTIQLGATVDITTGDDQMTAVAGIVLARVGVESMAEAIRLAGRMSNDGIIVVGAVDATALALLTPPDDAAGARIVLVDTGSWARDPELVIGGTVEHIARATHENYRAAYVEALTLDSRPTDSSSPSRPSLEVKDIAGFSSGIPTVGKSDPAFVAWPQLAPHFRESNRALARSVAAKLAAVGCMLVPSGLPSVRWRDDEIELLARLEHIRWCDERRSAGWRPGQRDPASRTTPFLVPWEELDDSARELDRAVVRDLPRFLADLGYAVLRVSRPAVDR